MDTTEEIPFVGTYNDLSTRFQSDTFDAVYSIESLKVSTIFYTRHYIYDQRKETRTFHRLDLSAMTYVVFYDLEERSVHSGQAFRVFMSIGRLIVTASDIRLVLDKRD